MRRILFIVGLQGSGKTTLINALSRKKIEELIVLKPSTTRAQRPGGEDEYHFESEWDHGNFAWTIQRGVDTYGMRQSEIDQIDHNQVGLTVFAPESIEALYSYRRESSDEIITVGLDTISSIEMQEERVEAASNRTVDADDFQDQVEVVKDCDIVLSGNPRQLSAALTKIIYLLSGRGGVLTKASISSLINAGSLLKGASPKNIESASYDLRIADTYWCQGRYAELKSDNDQVIIPPYSFVLVQAREQACLPRFVSGSFDLSVSMFFDGVVLSNGPQVDPGYRGSLFCMLYNSSDSEVALNRGQKFATIQFFTTSEVAEGYSGQYQNKKTFQDFLNTRASRSAGGKIFERISDIKKECDSAISTHRREVRALMIAFSSVFIAVFGIAFSKLSSETDRLADLRSKLSSEFGEIRDTANIRNPTTSTINIMLPLGQNDLPNEVGIELERGSAEPVGPEDVEN